MDMHNSWIRQTPGFVDIIRCDPHDHIIHHRIKTESTVTEHCQHNIFTFALPYAKLVTNLIVLNYWRLFPVNYLRLFPAAQGQ